MTEFTAFNNYYGPMSLATGWIAANEGGARRAFWWLSATARGWFAASRRVQS